jgi:hypothetical protein
MQRYTLYQVYCSIIKMGVADYRSYLYILDTLQIEKLQILKLVVYLDSVFYGKLDSNNTYINFASCFIYDT